LTRIK